MRKNQVLGSSLIVALSIVASLSVIGCSKVGPPKPPTVDPRDRLRQASDAVQKAPNFENYTQLGLVQLEQGDAASAAKSFEQTIKINDQSSIAHNNLCAAYNGMKQWARGITACNRALAIAPDMQLAQNNLGFAMESQKQMEARIQELDAKFQQNPADSDVALQLGLEYYTLGEYQKAISVWKRAPTGKPTDPVIQNNIASAAILMKDFSTASQAIERALAADPKNPLFLNNKNWLLQAQKEAGVSRQ